MCFGRRPPSEVRTSLGEAYLAVPINRVSSGRTIRVSLYEGELTGCEGVEALLFDTHLRVPTQRCARTLPVLRPHFGQSDLIEQLKHRANLQLKD
jgi:hypothetical protein